MEGSINIPTSSSTNKLQQQQQQPSSSNTTNTIIESRFETNLQQLLSPPTTDPQRAIAQAKVFFINLLDSIKSPTAYGGHRQLLNNVINSQSSFIALLMKYSFMTRDDTAVMFMNSGSGGSGGGKSSSSSSSGSSSSSYGYRGRSTHALTLLCAIEHSLERLQYARSEQQAQGQGSVTTPDRTSVNLSNGQVADPLTFQRVFIPVFYEIALKLILCSLELQNQSPSHPQSPSRGESQFKRRRKALSAFKAPTPLEKASMDFSNYSFSKQRCMIVVYLLSFLPDSSTAAYYDCLYEGSGNKYEAMKRLLFILKTILSLSVAETNEDEIRKDKEKEKSRIPNNITEIASNRLQVLLQSFYMYHHKQSQQAEGQSDNRIPKEVYKVDVDDEEISITQELFQFIVDKKQYELLPVLSQAVSNSPESFIPIIAKYIESLLIIPLKRIPTVGNNNSSSASQVSSNSRHVASSISTSTNIAGIFGEANDYGVSVMVKSYALAMNQQNRKKKDTQSFIELIAQRLLLISQQENAAVIAAASDDSAYVSLAVMQALAMTLSNYEEALIHLTKHFPKQCLWVLLIRNDKTVVEGTVSSPFDSSSFLKEIFATVREDNASRGFRMVQMIQNFITMNNELMQTTMSITNEEEKKVESIVNCLFDLLSVCFKTASSPSLSPTTSKRKSYTNSTQQHRGSIGGSNSNEKTNYFQLIVEVLETIISLQRCLYSQDLVLSKLILVLQHHEDDVERVFSRASSQNIAGGITMKEKIQSLLYSIEEYATTFDQTVSPAIAADVVLTEKHISVSYDEDSSSENEAINKSFRESTASSRNDIEIDTPKDLLISLFLQNLPELKVLFAKEAMDIDEGGIARSVTTEVGNADGDVSKQRDLEHSIRDGESIATTLAAAAYANSPINDGQQSNWRNKSPLSRKDSASSMSLSQSMSSKLQAPTVILCRLTGFIIKQGNFYPSWKRRYFILENRTLTYYASIEDANNQKPLSAPFIFYTGEDATTIRDKGKESLKLTLRNHGVNKQTSRKRLPLKFDSQEEKAMWKRAFAEHCTSDEMLSMKSSKPREKNNSSM